MHLTETGWPTQGTANNKAIPSVENQALAVKSILDTQGLDVILFTAFDDGWKEDTALTFSTEKVCFSHIPPPSNQSLTFSVALGYHGPFSQLLKSYFLGVLILRGCSFFPL